MKVCGTSCHMMVFQCWWGGCSQTVRNWELNQRSFSSTSWPVTQNTKVALNLMQSVRPYSLYECFMSSFFISFSDTVLSMGMVQQLVSVLRSPHSSVHEHVLGALCWLVTLLHDENKTSACFWSLGLGFWQIFATSMCLVWLRTLLVV